MSRKWCLVTAIALVPVGILDLSVGHYGMASAVFIASLLNAALYGICVRRGVS